MLLPLQELLLGGLSLGEVLLLVYVGLIVWLQVDRL